MAVTQNPGSPSTSADWARLVLADGGAPTTQQNIDNMLVWMQNEEPPSNWSDRNNPLNASLGTSAVDGTGSYPNLNTSAYYTAKMIFGQSNMISIANALATGTTDQGTFGEAVIQSPWASSHYGYNVGRFTGGAPSGSIPAAPGSNVGGNGSSTSGPGASKALVSVPLLGTILTQSQGQAILGGLLMIGGGIVLTVGVAFIAAYGLKRTGALNVLAAAPGPVGTTAKAVSSGGRSVGQAATRRQTEARQESIRQDRRAEVSQDRETRAAERRYAGSVPRSVASGVNRPSHSRQESRRRMSRPVTDASPF